MSMREQNRLLDEVERIKRGPAAANPAQLAKLLKSLARQEFSDPLTLARFHDVLLFFRAFPPSAKILRLTESLLRSFSKRIAWLKGQDVDLSAIEDYEEFSGIAGTTLTALLNYDETAWLVNRFPEQVDVDWESYDNYGSLGATLPRFIPLLEEEARVEASVDYRQWLRQASEGKELPWLVRQFARMKASPDERLELFASLGLPMRWRLGDSPASRTLSRHPVRQVFYHREPLIQRREVSIAREIAGPPLHIERLSRREGEKIITLCREATTVRYRELYGTSLGDPASVVRARVGRGVEIFLWGLLPGRRLPLRAYQAGFTLKNGVPVNYIEGIALFEWVEVGFNTFYAYRDGETAWIYAQALKLLHQILGVTCISVYPYQLGKGNEEATRSGAFWFYRKLGFRPMRPEIARLAAAEEKKIAADSSYRTSHATLRRLAQGHVVLELPGATKGAWDSFGMRNLGYAVNRRMSQRFGGNSREFRAASAAQIARTLNIRVSDWSKREQRVFEDLSVLLVLIPRLRDWTEGEKNRLVNLIRAKARGPEESYLRSLQAHGSLRRELLRLGSVKP